MKKSEFFIFPDEVDVANDIFANLQVNIENINKNRKNQKALVSTALACEGEIGKFFEAWAQTEEDKTSQLLSLVGKSFLRLQGDLGMGHADADFNIERSRKFLDSLPSIEEARLRYEKAASELNSSKVKLDELIREIRREGAKVEPAKLLKTYASFILHLRNTSAQFDMLLDLTYDTMWSLDYGYLKVVYESILQSRDSYLFQYEQFIEQNKTITNLQTKLEAIHEIMKTRKKQEEQKREREKSLEKDQLEREKNSKYNPLLEMLSADDLELMSILIDIAPFEKQPELLENIINIIDYFSRTMPIIKLHLSKEIALTDDQSTLLRGNSIATKLTTAYTKLITQRYVADLLRPHILRLRANPLSYEIDASKCNSKSGVDLQANLANLEQACSAIMNDIFNSLDTCPIALREISRFIQQEVTKRFPKAIHSSIGGFFFLRVICPAITSPDAYGICEGPLSSNDRRPLILVSKVIQLLANDTVMNTKDSSGGNVSKLMAHWLEKYSVELKSFYGEFVNIPSNKVHSPLCPSEQVRSVEFPKLHTYMVSTLEPVAKEMVAKKQDKLLEHYIFLLAQISTD